MEILTEIALPPKYQTPDEFCMWTVKTALKGKVAPRAINKMGLHKWWLMLDRSKGANTPETYAFFVNINVDQPLMSHYNTGLVCWSPIPFGWGFLEKLTRKLKRKNYPAKGDVLQVIPLNEHASCPLYQMKPIAYAAKDSRKLWDIMQNMGWTLMAQGETRTSNE